MKAAVLHRAREIIIEEVPFPKVEPDGVIVKVKACGICGSDIHVYKQGARGGMRMGHEFSGDIVEVGGNIKGVKEGDRVVAMSGRGCGRCYWCRQGDWLRCPEMVLLGYEVPGAFAEYVSVPNFVMGTYAAKLPKTLSYEEGATAEPLSVALYAVSRAKQQPEDTVVVIGVGVIGLCVIKILKSIGVRQIIASGRRSVRLRLARESGADLVVDTAQEDIVPAVKEATSGRGADTVFDCAGLSDTFHQAIQVVHRGGRVELVGLYEEPISWNPVIIVVNDITVGGCGLRFDLPGAVDLMQSGKVNTKPLITHEFALDEAGEAFETQITSQDAVKVLIKP